MTASLSTALELAVAAVERKPENRERFRQLADICQTSYTPLHRIVFTRLAEVLSKNPESAALCLNLAILTLAVKRPDMAKAFSGAAIAKGAGKLDHQEMALARGMKDFAGRAAHTIKVPDIESHRNPLILAARKCGIEYSVL